MKISERGEQRLHTLYMQDKSSKMKTSIYTYWKFGEPRWFKQLQNTTPQALIDGANIWTATWLYNNRSFGKPSFLDPRSSKLDMPRSLHLETRSVRASRREDQVSSFEHRVSTYFWAVSTVACFSLFLNLEIFWMSKKQLLLNSVFIGYEEFCRLRRVLSTFLDLQNSSYPMKAEFSNC